MDEGKKGRARSISYAVGVRGFATLITTLVTTLFARFIDLRASSVNMDGVDAAAQTSDRCNHLLSPQTTKQPSFPSRLFARRKSTEATLRKKRLMVDCA